MDQMTRVSQREMNKGKDCDINRKMSITEKYIDHREAILCPRNLQNLLLLLLLLLLLSNFSALAGKYSPILGCGNQQD